MATLRIVTVVCQHGHKNPFVIERNEGTPEQPSGTYGAFSTGESVERVPLASYAYTHGGCCYRAAVETLHGLHVYAG